VRAVNLIPVEQRGGSGPAAGRSEGGAYAVLVLLAGLAGLALLYGVARHQISSRRAQVASATAETQQAQATAAQLAPYTSFLALREQREQAVTSLAESRFGWAHAFHELGRVLPLGASIGSLSGTVGSPTSTTSSSSPSTGTTGSTTVASATPPGSIPSFTLAGCATSQSVVAETLNRLRLIDGVSTVALQASSTEGAGGGSSGGAGCATGDVGFNVQISFDPLPAVSATTGTATKSTGATG
jgi:Tfp pilus assembly protein PilN